MPEDKVKVRINMNVELRQDVWRRIDEWARAKYAYPDHPGVTDFDAAWQEIIQEDCMTVLWPGATPMPKSSQDAPSAPQNCEPRKATNCP